MARTTAASTATKLLLLLAHVAQIAAGGDDERNTGSCGKDFEWAGSFETPDTTYAWTMQDTVNVENKPGYENMKFVMLTIPGDTDADLTGVEAAATALMNGTCIDTVPHGSGSPPLVPGTCYNFKIEGADKDIYTSVFRLSCTGAYTAFYTEHVPTEFELSAHYFIDKDGGDVEPLHELKCEAETHKEWGAMIFACIVVNLCTLIGLLTFVPGIKGLMENEATRAAWLSGSSSFAAGALLAAAAFLMIPESVYMVSSKKNDPVLEEGEAAARVGIMLLLGFAIGLIIDTAVSAIKSDGPAGAGHVAKDEETPAIDKADESVVAVNLQFRTATSIFVGDFMHNLGDGFFIGAAFKVCGTSMGWTVAWGAFAHELAQELADYFVLVGPAGLVWWKAIILNVLSGTSVILGGIIVMASDVGDLGTGLILVFGAGVYIYIAAVEAVPRAFTPTTSLKLKLLNLGLFVLGCAGIGFVLYGHEHCEGEGGHH